MPGGRHAYVPSVNVWPSRRSVREPRRIHTSSQNSWVSVSSVTVPFSNSSIREATPDIGSWLRMRSRRPSPAGAQGIRSAGKNSIAGFMRLVYTSYLLTLGGRVELKLSPDGGPVDLEDPLVAIVGYSGHDPSAVQVHLDELAAHGVPQPAVFPAVWELDASTLAPAGSIEADPARSSGEAEPVLMRAGGHWYVSVGSDHTDRELERSSMAAAKSSCPKVVASECWPLADVEGALGRSSS